MTRQASSTDETGAVLIIALVFILTMGLLIGVLVTLATTNLAASTNLQNLRAGQYAADGALEAAVQTVRYSDAIETSSKCGTTSVVSVAIPVVGGSDNIGVWCSSASLGGSRQVSFWACPTSAPSGCQNLAQGQPRTPRAP